MAGANIFSKVLAVGETATPTNAVGPPIYQTSVYAFDDVEAMDDLLHHPRTGFTYSRGRNPNADALATFIAELEGTEAALVTSSGTAALLTAILTLRPAGGRILLPLEVYGGTVNIVHKLLEPLGYTPVRVDVRDAAAVEAALTDEPAVLALETISNPLGWVPELDRLIALAHARNIPVLVDNTFATPYHAEPARWGADLVVHSVTKFIAGHSDVILGVVAGSAERVRAAAEIVDGGGFTPDPFAAWLALRGARTLALRMERASQNALTLARALEPMPAIVRTYYPGLAGHPDHVHAERLLQRGYGAIVTLSLAGGPKAVRELVAGLRWVRLVPSLGDLTTTVAHPTPPTKSPDGRPRPASSPFIDGGQLRISVGIDAVDEVVEDFREALASIS